MAAGARFPRACQRLTNWQGCCSSTGVGQCLNSCHSVTSATELLEEHHTSCQEAFRDPVLNLFFGTVLPGLRMMARSCVVDLINSTLSLSQEDCPEFRCLLIRSAECTLESSGHGGSCT